MEECGLSGSRRKILRSLLPFRNITERQQPESNHPDCQEELSTRNNAIVRTAQRVSNVSILTADGRRPPWPTASRMIEEGASIPPRPWPRNTQHFRFARLTNAVVAALSVITHAVKSLTYFPRREFQNGIPWEESPTKTKEEKAICKPLASNSTRLQPSR